uniref:Reverse transcriptase Ty1/copia-type domain-containing protein n=1 Tax=Kalanchoe fedtschenkoi TaxID=63787 RepID=A0A7N0TCS0_KALFE
MRRKEYLESNKGTKPQKKDLLSDCIGKKGGLGFLAESYKDDRYRLGLIAISKALLLIFAIPKVSLVMILIRIIRVSRNVLFLPKKYFSQYDSSMFLMRTLKGLVVLLVYEGDIVITSLDDGTKLETKKHLQVAFHMKNLGNLNYFYGLEIHHRFERFFLASTRLEDGVPVDIFMEMNVKYQFDEGKLLKIQFCIENCILNIFTLLTHIASSCILLAHLIAGFFLKELEFSQSSPTLLHADNTIVIQIAANPRYHVYKACKSRQPLYTRVTHYPYLHYIINR